MEEMLMMSGRETRTHAVVLPDCPPPGCGCSRWNCGNVDEEMFPSLLPSEEAGRHSDTWGGGSRGGRAWAKGRKTKKMRSKRNWSSERKRSRERGEREVEEEEKKVEKWMERNVGWEDKAKEEEQQEDEKGACKKKRSRRRNGVKKMYKWEDKEKGKDWRRNKEKRRRRWRKEVEMEVFRSNRIIKKIE